MAKDLHGERNWEWASFVVQRRFSAISNAHDRRSSPSLSSLGFLCAVSF